MSEKLQYFCFKSRSTMMWYKKLLEYHKVNNLKLGIRLLIGQQPFKVYWFRAWLNSRILFRLSLDPTCLLTMRRFLPDGYVLYHMTPGLKNSCNLDSLSVASYSYT